MGSQEDGRGEFRQHALRQVEIHIEPFQTGKLLDLDLWEHHASYFMLHMRKSLKTCRKCLLASDVVRIHATELVPRHTVLQFDGRPDRLRFASTHHDAGMSLTV